MSAGADESQPAPERLLAVFGAPLVDALDGERPAAAAHALCLLARTDESLVTPLSTRLLAAFPESDAGSAVLRTLATFAGDQPAAVRTALDAEGAGRALRQRIADAERWQFDERADGGTDVATALRRIVRTDTPPSGPDVLQRDRTTPAPDGEDAREPDAGRAAARAPKGDRAAVDRRRRLQRAADSEAFRAISLLGDFDDLTVVEPEQSVRFGSVLRTRATRDGETAGVALRLFDRPDAAADRNAFAASLAESLARWEGVADHEGVVSVTDWGEYPRPWVATPYLTGSLADRGRPRLDRALREATHLAGALVHCHRAGTVHGGLDPASVVYPASSLGGLPAPRLDTVGLMDAVRRHFEPADYLDPRYAAPEYFSRSYGTVDAATDVYALGTVCFRLLTGRPPVRGDYETVRRRVLDGDLPAPSAVDPRLPSAVDEVVAKATAREKLRRYESVATLRRDLWRLTQAVDE